MLVQYRDFHALPLCDEGREFLRSVFGNDNPVLSTREICEKLKAERGALRAIETLFDFMASVKSLTAWVFIAQKAVDYVETRLAPKARAELKISISRVFDADFEEAQKRAFQFSDFFVWECQKAGIPENVIEDVFSMIIFYGEHVLRDALAMTIREERV